MWREESFILYLPRTLVTTTLSLLLRQKLLVFLGENASAVWTLVEASTICLMWKLPRGTRSQVHILSKGFWPARMFSGTFTNTAAKFISQGSSTNLSWTIVCFDSDAEKFSHTGGTKLIRARLSALGGRFRTQPFKASNIEISQKIQSSKIYPSIPK